jgi:hypothetical protein
MSRIIGDKFIYPFFACATLLLSFASAKESSKEKQSRF